MLGQRVRDILTGHGLAEYTVTVREGERYKTISPGFTISADHKRTCLVAYQTETPEGATQTDRYLRVYRELLVSSGLSVRPAQQTLALVVTDTSIEYADQTPAAYQDWREDIETYRRELLLDTARLFRDAIHQNRAKGRILTPEGKVNIKRKMREILTATPDSLILHRLNTERPETRMQRQTERHQTSDRSER